MSKFLRWEWGTLFIVYLLISSLIILLAGRSWASGLYKLVDEIKRNLAEFAGGNFSAKIEDFSQEKDVLEIKNCFENLRQMLNTWVYEVLYSTVSVGKSAKEINSGAKNSEAGMSEVARSFKEIREALYKTSAKFMDVAAATEELSSTSQSIAASSADVASHAQKAEKVAQEGNIAVVRTVQTMEEIRSTIENTARTIKNLAGASQEIGYIVSVISGIAEQTNLLALNAAIEAARAGQHGRGFAVVAEEVRKLAHESKEASAKIEGLINSIQKEIHIAVTAMEQSTQQVDSGVQIANQAKENLGNIIDAVEQVVELIESIAMGVNEQAQAAEQIAVSTEEVAGLSQASSSAVEEIAAGFEHQVGVINENSVTASTLAKVALKLETVMAKFDNVIGEQMIIIAEMISEIVQKRKISEQMLKDIAGDTGLSEIHVLDHTGKITMSTNHSLLGFQFKNEEGSQTRDFLTILNDPSIRVNQKTSIRDADGKLFKYVGVSRKDQVGIIQCGLEIDQIIQFKGKEAMESLRKKYLQF